MIVHSLEADGESMESRPWHTRVSRQWDYAAAGTVRELDLLSFGLGQTHTQQNLVTRTALPSRQESATVIANHMLTRKVLGQCCVWYG